MSAGYENDPNAIWERTLFLEGLKEVFAQHMAVAAIQFTDKDDSLTLLAGKVEPFNDGTKTYHENLSAFAICRTTRDWQQRIVLGFDAAMFPAHLYSYDIVGSPELFGRLNEKDTKIGRQHLHKLQRTEFTLALAEDCKQILFNGNRGMLSPWHKLLGIELPQRPIESETPEQ